MDHNITLAGHYYELRPVRLDDAEFIVELRTDPDLSRYLNTIPAIVTDQERYIRNYLSTPDDYYFVVQEKKSGAREGFIGIYDIDRKNRRAEWGRWILRKGSMAAVESADLIYRVGFEKLDLSEMYCRTVTRNEQVVSFHTSCGLSLARELPGHVTIDDVTYDSTEQVMSLPDWETCHRRMEEKARQIAALLNR